MNNDLKPFTYSLSSEKKASLVSLKNKWENSCARYKIIIVNKHVMLCIEKIK